MLEDLRTGWQAFTSQTWIWVVVVAFSLVNASIAGGVHVLGPVVADATIGRAGWGVVLSLLTGGMALGALGALRWTPGRPLRAGMWCSAVIAGLPLGLALRPTLPVLAMAAVLAGLCIETFGIAWDTSLQSHVAPDRLARVYSYDMLGSFVAIPVGEVAVGPAAEALGTRPVLLATAGIILVMSLGTLASRSVRELRRAEPTTTVSPGDAAPTLVS